jgi:branched-chain amino acid transport system permease protein
MTVFSPAQGYRRDFAGIIALGIALVLLGLFVSKPYHLTLLTYSGIYAVAALGMFVLFGYAGQISIGQGAFVGIGAYASALLVMRVGLPPIVALIASAAASGLFGFVVSRPLLRLTTNYLAMATLAFGVICSVLFSQATSITGGIDPGIFGVPPFEIFSFQFVRPQQKYWLVAMFVGASMFVTINLVHSRFGRALKALSGSEVATAGLGVDVVRYKVLAFTMAASMAGLSGSLLAFVQSSFSASAFTVGLSLDILIMVVVGSLANPWGALFGALFVTIVPTFLETFELYKALIFGVIITIAVIFMPDGLIRGVKDIARNLLKKRRQA